MSKATQIVPATSTMEEKNKKRSDDENIARSSMEKQYSLESLRQLKHEAPIKKISFNHNSTALAVGGYDRCVTIYDTNMIHNYNTIAKFQHKHIILDLSWSKDGKLLASCGGAGKIKGIDFFPGVVVDEKESCQFLNQKDYTILYYNEFGDLDTFVIHGDEKFIESLKKKAKEKEEDMNFDRTPFDRLVEIEKKKRPNVSLVKVYAGRYSKQSGRVTLYDMVKMEIIKEFQTAEWVSLVSFSHNSKLLAAGGFDKKLTIYNVSKNEILDEYVFPNTITTISWSHDDQFISCAGADCCVTIIKIKIKV
jgi:WD40 repeat protein